MGKCVEVVRVDECGDGDNNSNGARNWCGYIGDSREGESGVDNCSVAWLDIGER